MGVLNRASIIGGVAVIASTTASYAQAQTMANDAQYSANALEPLEPFDVRANVSWRYETRSAAIQREVTGHPQATPDGPIPVARDLILSSERHVVTPRLRIGIRRGLALTAALPIVAGSNYGLEFDQRNAPCEFRIGNRNDGPCVDRTSSTTLVDGLLPTSGYDAQNPSSPGFAVDDATIFRGTPRSGLDQVHLGMSWAPMHQGRDETKPTWHLSAELLIAIGAAKTFRRDSPSSATSVGRGVHELRLGTSMRKRVTWIEPFIALWWQTPIGVTSDSQFLDLGFGSQQGGAQQQAGTHFGGHAILWENPPAARRISLELSATLESYFEGRDYSPMWEVFALAGDSATNRSGPLVLDADPTQPGSQARSHPGVTNIEDHLTITGKIGLGVQLGPTVRLGASFELLSRQRHLITYADAGIDLPTCGDNVTTNCEPTDDDTVNPGTSEVNPYHVPLIDRIGDRYQVTNDVTISILFGAAATF